MLGRVRLIFFILATFFGFLGSIFPAHAYIDPGSGSLILQGFAAIGLGVLFYFRKYYRTIMEKLGLGSKLKHKLQKTDDIDP